MRSALVLAALAAISGCVADGQPLNDETEMKAYVQCNHDNATRFAKQSGDPVSLAIAAEASCARSKAALMRAWEAARGPGRALALTDSVEEAAIRSNTGTIVRVRAG